MRTFCLKYFFTVFVFFISLCGFVIPAPSLADIQYVSDLLIISIRDGQDPDAAVLGYLRSAAAVDILEETNELMRIRTEDGIQGWVRKKFIVPDKPKAVIINELNEKVAILEENIQTLQEGSDAQGLQKLIDGYKQRVTNLTASLDNEKRTRLALQRDLKKVNTEHRQLVNQSKKNQEASKELASLKNENKTLKDKLASIPPPADETPMLSGNMKWFLIGGGVLLLGFIVGRALKGKRSYRY